MLLYAAAESPTCGRLLEAFEGPEVAPTCKPWQMGTGEAVYKGEARAKRPMRSGECQHAHVVKSADGGLVRSDVRAG